MPPLLADFIYGRVCELKCEKFLTRPTAVPDRRTDTNDSQMSCINSKGCGKIRSPFVCMRGKNYTPQKRMESNCYHLQPYQVCFAGFV